WAANRRLYPGWLIPPSQSCDSLASHTKFWIAPLLASLPALSPEQRLSTLWELNWRLETALLPLFPNVVDAFTKALEQINPFGETLNAQNPELTLTAQNANTFDWATLRQTWLALAFGLLRFHREERQHEKFEEWVIRLQSLITGSLNHEHRLCYER